MINKINIKYIKQNIFILLKYLYILNNYVIIKKQIILSSIFIIYII